MSCVGTGKTAGPGSRSLFPHICTILMSNSRPTWVATSRLFFFEEISWEEQEWETFLMILQKAEMAPILLAKEVQEELGDLQFAAKEILRKKNIGLPI